jgi:hypothetical protein
MSKVVIGVIVMCLIIVVVVVLLYVTGCLSPKNPWYANQEQENISLPKICRIWDRWVELDEDVRDPSAQTNRLGNAWQGSVCPATSLYQKINQLDRWCVSPPRRNEYNRELCAHYISNDEMAEAVSPTVDTKDPLAAFDRWVELKQALGMRTGEKRGASWQGSVCPAGACYQLLANQESWCVPKESVQLATKEAGNVA